MIDKVTRENWMISPSVPTNVRADKVNEIIEVVNDLTDGTFPTGNITIDGILANLNTTDATSKDTGSFVLEGGIGVEKNVYAGVNVYAGGRLYVGNGLLATPSITFIDFPALGFYAISGSQMGFASNSVMSAYFDEEGIWANSIRPRVQYGSTPVATVTVKEYGDGKNMTTVLELTNFIIGALDGAAADKGIGNIVYAFPAGKHIEEFYAISEISLKAAGTPVNTDTGLGSVIASGVVNVLSGTATFEDRLTGQTIATAPAGGAASTAASSAIGSGVITGIALNVDGSVKNVFLNSAGTWNVDNTGNLTASGTITLKWTIITE